MIVALHWICNFISTRVCTVVENVCSGVLHHYRYFITGKGPIEFIGLA